MNKDIKEQIGECQQTSGECGKHILAIRDTLDILNGKWKLPIIVALIFDTKRFKQLERDIVGVTAKMLSKELKDLEINGLVKRTVFDTTPVTVEYSLTEYGRTLKTVIGEMHTWGTQHRARVTGKVNTKEAANKEIV